MRDVTEKIMNFMCDCCLVSVDQWTVQHSRNRTREAGPTFLKWWHSHISVQTEKEEHLNVLWLCVCLHVCVCVSCYVSCYFHNLNSTQTFWRVPTASVDRWAEVRQSYGRVLRKGARKQGLGCEVVSPTPILHTLLSAVQGICDGFFPRKSYCLLRYNLPSFQHVQDDMSSGVFDSMWMSNITTCHSGHLIFYLSFLCMWTHWRPKLFYFLHCL